MEKQPKVALVTGGSQGIGKAITKRLIKDGFAVAIVALKNDTLTKTVEEFRNNGDEVIAIPADVSDRDQVFAATETTIKQLGDLNVVVNNAGVGPATPIDTITPDQFHKVFDINVAGNLWGIQAAHQAFKKLGHGGKIINAASQAGIVGNPNMTLYSSSKFAVRGITQVAARDLAKDKITVNAYAPGVVDTPMMQNVYDGIAKQAGKDTGWAKKVVLHTEGWDNVALGRLSKPEDVAKAVSFLAGPDSDYITGQTIIVDGGMVFH